MEMIIKKVESFDRFIEAVDSGDTSLMYTIECVNWPRDYGYAPDVVVAIAHDSCELFIKYIVNEECTKAEVDADQGPVATDSCVEFFVSFDDSGYYNFEFNCIGRTLLKFRKVRSEATPASAEVLGSISRFSTLGDQPFAERCGDNVWELDVRIPASAFFRHAISDLSGMTARANFYKCGDGLSKPHYLSWNPIDTPSPDFHREEFFGDLRFE